MTYVLYHSNCFDGFGAAWAAWKALGDATEYIACTYGSPLPDLPVGSNVTMVDFSGPRDLMIEWSKKYQFLVLDHHKSAQANLEGLDFCQFDMNQSGAMLAWKHFHTDPPPDLINYIQDRDLWINQLPQTEEVHAALASYPKTFEIWDKLTIDQLKEEGGVLLRYRHLLVNMIVDQAQWIVMGDHRIVAVNATSHWSEVGNTLCKRFPESPFAASYYFNKDGNKIWSLRSVGDFDVSAIAKSFGGGGHKNAAGFIDQAEDF